MKTVDLLRHCDNEDDALSPEGVEHALEIGRERTLDYDIAVSSGRQRATQTIACMIAGAGASVPGGVWVDERFYSGDPERWKSLHADTSAVHLEEFLAVARDFVVAEAEVMSRALSDVFGRLAEGGRALVMGHGPTQEAAVYGLTGVLVPALKKGAGVSVTERAGEHEVTSL